MNNYTAIICYHVFTADVPAPFQGGAVSRPHQKSTGDAGVSPAECPGAQASPPAERNIGDAGVSPADGLAQTAQLRIVRINN